MAKVQIQSNPRVNQIFDDLEKFKDFCVQFGYRFDESCLYNMRNYAYQQYSKFCSNKNFKNQWAEDQRRFDQQQQRFS
jgi:hypothetical protein